MRNCALDALSDLTINPARPWPAAILFDLDGTLIDSAPDLCDAIAVLLAEHHRRPLSLAETRAMVGDGATELVRRAFAATGPALVPEAVAGAVARYLEIYAAHPVRPDCIYPGVVETLTALAAAGHRLGLCTNKPQPITRAVLEALDLARFFAVVLGAQVLPVRKPDPGPLLWVTERLGVAPAAALMVGDSRNDVLAATAAGMAVVVVSYGYTKIPAAELGAAAVIDHFAELGPLLTNLASSLTSSLTSTLASSLVAPAGGLR
jgi:phosphoglycolate phosphatase